METFRPWPATVIRSYYEHPPDSGYLCVDVGDKVSVLCAQEPGAMSFSDCWLSWDEGRSWSQQLEAAPWAARSHMGMVALPTGALVLARGFVNNNKFFSDCWQS